MRVRIAGVVVLVLLGAGLLIRSANQSELPPKNTDGVPLEIQANTKLLATETVDLKNGNLHLEILIRAGHQKTTAPRSDRQSEYLPLLF